MPTVATGPVAGRVHGVLVASMLAALVCLFAVNPAEAAYRHVPGPTFDLPPAASAQPAYIAVDETTDSIYVMRGTTPNAMAIEKFDKSGTPQNFSATGSNLLIPECTKEGADCRTIAVDNSDGPNNGTIYVGNTTAAGQGRNPGLHVYSRAGAHVATVRTRTQDATNVSFCGAAVDDDGLLYIAHPEGSTAYSSIDKIEPPNWSTHPDGEPKLLGVIGSDYTQPCRISVAPDGSIFGLPQNFPNGTGAVRRFAPGSFIDPRPAGYDGGALPASFTRNSTVFDNGTNGGVATDANGDVFVARTNAPIGIRKLADDGSVTELFGSELSIPIGMAVNREDGLVIVGDRGTAVGVKDIRTYTRVVVPDVTTGPAAPASQTAFDLTGEVEPIGGDEVTDCQFEYVTETAFNANLFASATHLPCAETLPIGETTEISADLTGLTKEQPYRVRLTVVGENGASSGRTIRVVPHAVVGLETEDADAVKARSARLRASMIGNGEATEYYFEYGKTLNYGEKTPTVQIGSPTEEEDLEAAISGLELETTYNFRVVAKNTTGESKGDNLTFTTAPAVAGVETDPDSDVSYDKITLKGSFVGNGDATSYYFEYGPTYLFGEQTAPAPGESAGSPTGTYPVSADITRFSGFTTYYYRLVAENSDGIAYGPTRKVSTEETSPPGVGELTISDVTRTAATVTTTINPRRGATAYLFEYGPSLEYGSETPLAEPLDGLVDEEIQVSQRIEGLTPGSIHHVRAVAINFAGTTNGIDASFITPDLPALSGPTVTVTGQTSAHVSLRAAGMGSPAAIHLEYGPTAALGASTAPVAIGASLISSPLELDLTGLAPGTTYQLRAVGTNDHGRSEGAPVTFTTTAAPTPPAPTPRPDCRQSQVRRNGTCVCKKTHVKKGGKCIKRSKANAKKKKKAKAKKRRGAANGKRARRA